MKIKFAKMHPQAVIPKAETAGAAGLDLTIVQTEEMKPGIVEVLSTGLAAEIPSGHVGILCLRSSLGKLGFSIPHGLGIIDSDYRGEIKIPMVFGSQHVSYTRLIAGDRVAQLVVVPVPEMEVEEVELDELTRTDRGAGGFGSTGN